MSAQSEYCRNYYINHREVRKAQSRAYYRKHRDSCLATSTKYRKEHKKEKVKYDNEYSQKNKEKKQKQNRLYFITHREKHYQSSLKFRNNHREKYLCYQHDYYKTHKKEKMQYIENNREKIRETQNIISSRYRARKRMLEASLTLEQWEAIKSAYKYRCAYCGKKTVRLTQDHVISVSLDGPYVAWNIVPACLSCNSQKRDKVLAESPSVRLMI